MNWKRIISSVLAAGMLLATPVQLLASAESAEDAESTNAWESLLTADDIDEENTFTYSKNGYSFEKLSHPEKDVKTGRARRIERFLTADAGGLNLLFA